MPSGSVVAAGSAFVLCVGASYPSAIVFVVLLSIGEAIYSPAVFEFNMLVAPKGREGMSVSPPARDEWAWRES
mgnify:CR=1 FL=1